MFNYCEIGTRRNWPICSHSILYFKRYWGIKIIKKISHFWRVVIFKMPTLWKKNRDWTHLNHLDSRSRSRGIVFALLFKILNPLRSKQIELSYPPKRNREKAREIVRTSIYAYPSSPHTEWTSWKLAFFDQYYWVNSHFEKMCTLRYTWLIFDTLFTFQRYYFPSLHQVLC